MKSQRLTKDKRYSCWNSMHTRCYVPSVHKFEYYGGRGIKVCTRWQKPGRYGFINFCADMGKRWGKNVIDRIDNDGDYSPDNCRWLSPLRSRKHRRKKPKVYTPLGRNIRLKRLFKMGKWRCSDCEKIKLINCFYSLKSRKIGIQNICIPCNRLRKI